MRQVINPPKNPPPLHELVAASSQQVSAAQKTLGQLSHALEGAPVLLSQDGAVVGYAGIQEQVAAEKMARMAARAWREGATRPAREYIHFDEETIGSEEDRANLLMYSVHLAGALTLTIGWGAGISLTQLRAETEDALIDLRRSLSLGEGRA